MNKKYREAMAKYNTTELDVQNAFERHVFHRDMFAHYFRWMHFHKQASVGESVCDFGCGTAVELLKVLYCNRLKQKQYTGFDIRELRGPDADWMDEFVPWARFEQCDLVKAPLSKFADVQADKVVSFEVIEHVGKQNAQRFLKRFKSCGKDDAMYMISTPCYDERVGAAGNHTYDSGDGRGEAPQEFTSTELEKELTKAGFDIVKRHGTFASIKDYKPAMSDAQTEVFNQLREYYPADVMANIMAPMFPDHARNCLWILKRK